MHPTSRERGRGCLIKTRAVNCSRLGKGGSNVNARGTAATETGEVQGEDDVTDDADEEGTNA